MNNQLKSYPNQLLRNVKKRKVYPSFKDNIQGVGFSDIQSLSKLNKGIRFVLCVIDSFSKNEWVIPLKDKKNVTIVNAFPSILPYPKRKPNKIWIGSELYNRLIKSQLQYNDIKMYSKHNEGKSVVAERLIRTLQSRVYKYRS